MMGIKVTLMKTRNSIRKKKFEEFQKIIVKSGNVLVN